MNSLVSSVRISMNALYTAPVWTLIRIGFLNEIVFETQSTLQSRDPPTFFDKVRLIKVICVRFKENLLKVSREKSLN